ncbi:MAG: translesion error-prone DNA polymerase V autoproteolytic subunit [Betaproteobacteria bacterium]|nr:translesion error-prone DNA polymerase V autoproteolytic subunit [Betaproteobacteria bacterium]
MSNQPGRGGKRAGAGRKTTYGEPTKQVRIPISQIAVVSGYLRALRKQVPVESQLALHNIEGIFPVMMEPSRSVIPLMSHTVPAGFPSPADDYIEDRIDLNTHLITHREATFILRVSGWSMINAGIHDGDEIIVDRALNASHGNIVVAVVNNELTVKRLHQSASGIRLVPENPDFADIVIKADEELMIWGVVTRVLHKV